jgi:1-acyl-sn-glycerol-3-phosphate acyltransferase
MKRVLLLGGPGHLTRVVAERLRESREVESCEVFDLQGAADPKIPGDPGFEVVYLGPAIGERGLAPTPEQTEACLGRAADHGARSLVVVSSAAIFPPRHPHPGMVDEARPPLRSANAIADGWAALELAARRVFEAHPSLIFTMVRPAAVPTPDGLDYLSRLLRGRVGATCVGHDPSIQLLSPDDLGRALASIIEASSGGVFHIAPSSVVPVHKAMALARTMRVPLPVWLQRVGRSALRGLGVAPWADAERLRYSSTVSGSKIEETLGFKPRVSSAEVAATFGGRRPAEGDSGSQYFDPYGQDKAYIAWLHRTVIGFLHNVWWRVEVSGIENVPRAGGGVLTGVHRGFMPFDGTMLLYDVVKRVGRYPRFLIHPNLQKEVFLADFITRQGGVIACRQNADWVLQRGDLLGFFPEGVEGAFSYYRVAHRLCADFGRDEFVKTALRNRVPIVPFVTVGNVEIFPVLAKFDWEWWKQLTGWPCFPIAPPFPLLPIPLPTKWHTMILEPLHIEEAYGPEAASDEETVRKIGNEVRARLQTAIDEMRARRRWIFFGSIFNQPRAKLS